MEPIRLDDDVFYTLGENSEGEAFPGWNVAQQRLRQAADYFGFPFWIVMDEHAEAYRNIDDYIRDEVDLPEAAARALWFEEYAVVVDNMEEAERALWPWYHDGEDISSGGKGDPLTL